MRKLLFLVLFLPQFLLGQPLSWQQLDSLSTLQYQDGQYREGLLTTQKYLGLIATQKIEVIDQLPILLKEAQFTMQLGFYRKADSLTQEVIRLFRVHKQTTHSLYPAALSNLGHTQMLLGRYKLSEASLLQSKVVMEYQGDALSDGYVENLIYLGLLKVEQTQFNSAKKHYDSVLSRIGTTSKWYGQMNMHLGAYFLEKEKFDTAQTYFDDAKRVIQHTEPNYAILMNLLGRFYLATADYEKAEISFNQALNYTEKYFGKNHLYYIKVLNNLGVVYYSLGSSRKAIQVLQEAKTKCEKEDNTSYLLYANIINTLALVYEERGEHLTVVPNLLEQAGKIFLNKNLPAKYASIQYNLGNHYFYYTSTPEKAIKHYEQAIKSTNIGNQTYAIFCSGLAKAYFIDKKYLKADSIANKANQICLDYHYTYDLNYVHVLTIQAKIKEQLGEIQNASKFHIQYAQLLGLLIREYYPSMSESERIDLLQVVGEKFDLIASFLIRHPVSTPNLNKTFLELNLSTKELALESSINARYEWKNRPQKEANQLINNLKKTRRTILDFQLLPKKEKKEKKLTLDSLINVVNNIDKELSRLNKSYLDSLTTTLKFREFTYKIAPKEAAISTIRFEYYDGLHWTGKITYFAMLIKRDLEFPKIVKLSHEEDINLLLKKSSTSENSYIQNDLINYELFQAVWQPLEPHLKEIESIHLEPTGSLNQIAFHALKTKDRLHLIKKYQFNYYSNLKNINSDWNEDDYYRSEHQYKNDKQRNLSILLVGDIQYGQASKKKLPVSNKIVKDSLRGTNFERLKNTQTEINNIKKRATESSWKTASMTNLDAQEKKFSTYFKTNQPSVIHIATHGFYYGTAAKTPSFRNKDTGEQRIRSASDPLIRTGLAFSNINIAWKGTETLNSENDGILTAYEIMDLDLNGTDLVVLSACNTGLGTVQYGEGVFGLQRAFKAAGVKKSMVSLWQVPDRETQLLMDAFYIYYLQGLSPETALRKAQIDLSKKHSAFNWAAFIIR